MSAALISLSHTLQLWRPFSLCILQQWRVHVHVSSCRFSSLSACPYLSAVIRWRLYMCVCVHVSMFILLPLKKACAAGRRKSILLIVCLSVWIIYEFYRAGLRYEPVASHGYCPDCCSSPSSKPWCVLCVTSLFVYCEAVDCITV